MSAEDEAARRVAQIDQARAKAGEAAAVDAKGFADFYSELRGAGMTEDQAFTLTHEWMILTLSAEEAEDDE